MEIIRPPPISGDRCHASMEPRFFKRGNEPSPLILRRVTVASMEPRFFKRGNTGGFPGADGANNRLQWSHVFSNVEILNRRVFSPVPRVLQWSHVFSNVEISRLTWCAINQGTLQWSHVFSNVEMPPLAVMPPLSPLASMEPRFFKRGNRQAAGRPRRG